MELSSSEAAEQAASRRPGRRLITLLPPCCFPNHLGKEEGISELAVFPTVSFFPREDEGDAVANDVSARAVTAQASVCPSPATGGEGGDGRGDNSSSLVLIQYRRSTEIHRTLSSNSTVNGNQGVRSREQDNKRKGN